MRSCILNEYIQQVLSEAETPGSSFEREEEDAKAKYLQAKSELEIWDKENEKKNAYLKKLADMGLSPDSKSAVAQALLKNPRYAFDKARLNKYKKRDTLVNTLNNAKEAYGKYDPSVVGYMKTGKKTAVEAEEIKFDNKPMPKYKWEGGPQFNVKNVSMQWVAWPAAAAKFSGTGFGKQKEGERGEAMGTGPGEKWLAAIFGGKVAGGSVSYDVIMPDGTKCECKELASPSSLVRPGTEGLAAIEKARERLGIILSQLKEFISATSKGAKKFKDIMTDEEKKVVYYIRDFLTDEYENIMGKGEISRERIAYLRAVLKQVKILKLSHQGSDNDTVNIKPSITLNKKTKIVSRPTFIDIAKKVESEVGEDDILGDFQAWDLVLNCLKDTAFTDYVKFLDDWYASVSVDEVFRQTDGVFIVNERRGFFWIPKDNLKSMLRFEVISQGKPKFRFLGW